MARRRTAQHHWLKKPTKLRWMEKKRSPTERIESQGAPCKLTSNPDFLELAWLLSC